MSFKWDCPKCNNKNTMILNSNEDIYKCNNCGFKAETLFLAGYWIGYKKGKNENDCN